MRTFIAVAVLFASVGCNSELDAAPKPSPSARAGAGSAAKAGSATDPWAAGSAAKAGSATDPWAAGPSSNAGSATGSAATPKPSAEVTPSTRPAKDAAEGAKKTSTSGEGSWQCTASSSVRVCGFAGACNYQMVFGNGWGKDRFFASKQAKSSCEASARTKGAIAVCVVQCSVR